MNISLKKRTFLILLAGLTATFASAQEQPLPEWQSQYAVGLNKLAPHTYVWPYANASDIEKPGGYEQSPFYMTLNGKWKFHWVKNPDNECRMGYHGCLERWRECSGFGGIPLECGCLSRMPGYVAFEWYRT